MPECIECKSFKRDPPVTRDMHGFCFGVKNESHRKLDRERGGDWRSIVKGAKDACGAFRRKAGAK